MIFKDKEALIKFRIKKAKATLDAAKLLMQGDNQGYSAANRLYYSCFYAVSALLAKSEINFKTHKSVKNALNQYFVLSKKIDSKWGQMFIDLFELRQDADYADMLEINNDTVFPYIEEVEKFIAIIEKILTEN